VRLPSLAVFVPEHIIATTPPSPHPAPVSVQLTPLERLKTHLALAQAAVVLYTLDRQLDAAKLDSHPIQKEVVSCCALDNTWYSTAVKHAS
jgi:hypothetical protein